MQLNRSIPNLRAADTIKSRLNLVHGNLSKVLLHMRFEATATRPDKCHLDIKRAVTHPRVNKAEPCLTKATTNLTSYHSAARLVKSSVEELD